MAGFTGLLCAADLAAGLVAVRRSAGVIRNAGEGAAVVEGPTKTDESRRVISIDPDTARVLRDWWRKRHSQALQLATSDELVFNDLEGGHRHPARFSRLLNRTADRAIKAGADFGRRLREAA